MTDFHVFIEIEEKCVDAPEAQEEKMWKWWAIGEGLMKTLSALFQKTVGIVMGTLEMGFLAAGIIGGMQALSGWIGRAAFSSQEKKSPIFVDRKTVATMIFLGFLAGIFGTVLSIYTFTLGADIGVRTLLISFSVVPAAIAAAYIWPSTDALNSRQKAGIGVFILAMWAILDFPDVSLMANMDAWVWLTLLLAAANALGELVSRAAAAKADVWVNNIWIGSSTVFFSIVGLVLFFSVNGWGSGINITPLFMWSSIVIGAIVVAMVSFKILAYRGGGTIALKKIIVPGVYLISALFAGVFVYGEPLTVGKMVGVGLWFVSVYLVDSKAGADLKHVFPRMKTA
ncbi:MAG: hypothetical protein WAZ27_02955 [Minisyncoccia bacterium]